jgi:hypothetical protein
MQSPNPKSMLSGRNSFSEDNTLQYYFEMDRGKTPVSFQDA